MRIAADVARRDTEGYPEAWAETAHTIRNGRGEPVCLSPAAAQAFWHLARKADGAAQVAGLKRLARVSGIDRLYVHAADTKLPVELSRYLKGLAAEDYYLSGTGPMRLVVSFPRPRLAVLSRETEAERSQRWVKTLTELPVQRAVVRLSSGQTGEVQVMNVADPTAPAGFERFLSAAVAGSGQSAREVEQAQAWRREEVEWVAGESKLAEQPVPHQEGQHGTNGPPGKSIAPATYSSTANSFTTHVPKPLNHNKHGNNQAKRGGSQRKKQLSESDQTSPALAVPTAYEPIIAEDGSLA